MHAGALVAGHVNGLVLAHERALKTYSESPGSAAIAGWLLAVMIAFTTLGLFSLSESNQ